MGVIARFTAAIGWRDNGESPYECTQCGHRFRLQYYQCPKCGGYRVERAKWRIE